MAYLIQLVFQLLWWLYRSFVYVYCQYIIGPLCTPRGHRTFGSYKETEAYQSLERESYSIQPMWRSDAVSRIEKKTRK